MINKPFRELKNPGASGSLFYLTADDEFIIKTVEKKEAEFLKSLLPGYYMVRLKNIHHDFLIKSLFFRISYKIHVRFFRNSSVFIVIR